MTFRASVSEQLPTVTSHSHSLQEVDDSYLQRIRERLERLKGDVRLAALDFADVSAVEARPIRHRVLRPASLQA